MNHPTFGNGKICYIEIPSNDIRQSATFYQTIFGWNIRNDQDGNISFDDAVSEVSGTWISNRKPHTEIGLIISIMVYDIAATIALIKDHGGTILNATLDSNEKTALFSDPTGNLFGLYHHGKSD